MPALIQRDVNILQSYADNGQRERYWGYLAALGDKYAVRALEVVQNSSMFGQLANNHATAFVPGALKATFNEAGWNEFGKGLMRADLAARKGLFNDGIGTGDRGLTLDGETIRRYHKTVFSANGIPAQGNNRGHNRGHNRGQVFQYNTPTRIPAWPARFASNSPTPCTTSRRGVIGARTFMLMMQIGRLG